MKISIPPESFLRSFGNLLHFYFQLLRFSVLKFLFDSFSKLLSFITISESLLKCSILPFIFLNRASTVIYKSPQRSSCFCACLLYRAFFTQSRSNPLKTKLTSSRCLTLPVASSTTPNHPQMLVLLLLYRQYNTFLWLLQMHT